MSCVQFIRHHPDVIMPKKGSADAAAFDLYSHSMSSDDKGYTVRTGLSIALPPRTALLIMPRSGLSTKLGLVLQNSIGLVDEDYRGELVVKFTRGYDSHQAEISQVLQYGNRIAQALILALPEVIWTEVDCLPTSERGESGFGSSGVR